MLLVSLGAAVPVRVEYLSEIVAGRCYYRPPNNSIESCPTVTGYLLSALNANLDDNITPASYSDYFDNANFQPTDKGGLFWLKGDQNSFQLLPPEWLTPETTPGGALMDGLTFCGIDLQLSCPKESGASTVFWTSVYEAYAKLVKGEVHIIVEEKADLGPLLQGAIPSLPVSDLESITIYANDCMSDDVVTINSALTDVVGSSVIVTECIKGPESFFACQDPKSDLCMCLQGGAPPLAPPKPDTPLPLTPPKSDSPPPLAPPKPISPEGDLKNQIKPDNNTPNSEGLRAKDTPDQSRGKGSSDSTYKILFWLLLVVFSFAFYVISRRQLTGYTPIPTHHTDSVLPKQ